MVYLKELDARGFVVYSNWDSSQKARDLKSNAHVALCFWWKPLERQVRVEGVGERLSTDESQVYFGTRARGSRVGAWASRQSEVLRPRARNEAEKRKEVGNAEVGAGAGKEKEGRDGGDADDDDGRAQLEEQVREVEKRFQGQDDIPVPEFWGGLRVIPDMVEFWQGRESRLHDRFRYQKVSPSGDGKGKGDAEWKIERLSP
jgi:pyridoxamine 5'-phosphate oxidase